MSSTPALTYDLQAIVELLSDKVDRTAALGRLAAIAKRAGLDPGRLDTEQTLRVLEELSRETGVLGVSARFARVRVILAGEG